MNEIGRRHMSALNRRCIFSSKTALNVFNFDFPNNVVADEKLAVKIKESFSFIKEHETTI